MKMNQFAEASQSFSCFGSIAFHFMLFLLGTEELK